MREAVRLHLEWLEWRPSLTEELENFRVIIAGKFLHHSSILDEQDGRHVTRRPILLATPGLVKV